MIIRYISLIFFTLSTFHLAAQNDYSTEVDGVCEMCEDRIEKAALSLESVHAASWDLESHVLTIEHNTDFIESELHDKLNSVGHDTEVSKASQEAYDGIHACCRYRDEEVQKAHSDQPNAEGIKYETQVSGICQMCKGRIERASLEIDGVQSADWTIETEELVIIHDSDFNKTELHDALNSVGHDTEISNATQEEYDGIHACCRYRDQDVIDSHSSTIVEGAGEYDIMVNGLCEMCKERIEEAALEVNGIKTADFSIDDQRLYMEIGEDFEVNDIHKAISGAGHDTNQLLASDEEYNKLAACCKYRDKDSQKEHGVSIEKRSKKVIGYVFETAEDERKPLESAEIYTVDGKDFAFSDKKGYFEMKLNEPSTEIVISYIGYQPDTIQVSYGSEVEAILQDVRDLKEVVISYKQRSSGVSSVQTVKTYMVDDTELLKAACCNLAESFETLPAVDVATTDAVTGTRQVKMLGLSGPNILYTREQLPVLSSLAAVQGLTLFPGPWIAGMQLNQGVGSAIDGYESVSGQINLELRKPESMDPLYLNLYGNEMGRIEGNAHFAKRFNKKLSTGLLLHANSRTQERDRNDDGFLDAPTGDGFVALNRWKYKDEGNFATQAGVQYSRFDTESGQLSDLESPGLWRAGTKVRDLQAWAKAGVFLPSNPYESIALKLGANLYEQDSRYGERVYSGDQEKFDAQLIYQNYIGTSMHKISAGLGIEYDKTTESLEQFNFDKEEIVPNAVAEYTWTPNETFSAVLGARYDLHNTFGGFFTPRVHLKYGLDNGLSFRMGLGQARRVASIISENISVLASSRDFVNRGDDTDIPYGLPMIKSNNLTGSVDYAFDLFGYNATLSLDYFYTQFDENVIVDLDSDINQMRIYQQNEDSYSHNLQFQMDFSPIEKMDIRLAYKWQLLKLGYESGLREAPFTPGHRAFLNAAYTTDNNWSFDATFNLTGTQRIPDTDALSQELQMRDNSPAYLRINAQISKELFSGFTVYSGVENLTNYRQEYVIIGAENPFSDTFDASLVWGPTMGRNVYAGIRYTIMKFDENKFQ